MRPSNTYCEFGIAIEKLLDFFADEYKSHLIWGYICSNFVNKLKSNSSRSSRNSQSTTIVTAQKLSKWSNLVSIEQNETKQRDKIQWLVVTRIKVATNEEIPSGVLRPLYI